MTIRKNEKIKKYVRQIQKDKLYFGINITYALLIFCIGLLGIYYVWNVNSTATLGYDISELKVQNNNLKMEMELLDVKVAELDSLSELTDTNDMNIMEKVEDPDYLVIKEGKTYVYND